MLQESNRVEFKSVLNDKMEKEIVAFLNNQEGGVLYIGLDDAGRPLKNENLDATQLKIADRIKNNILPSTMGLFDIATEIIEDIPVIKIIISSGLEKPYYIRNQGMSPSGCFTRIGTSTQPMTTAMIDDLYAKRIHTTLRNILSPRQDLNFSQLKIYYQERGFELNQNFANSLELYTPDGKYNYIAYLLADENGVSIKVAKYAGTDKVDLIENEEYGYCSLIKATKNVLDKLKIENVTLAKVTSTTRIEKNLIDPVALREAVINAIVH
ncbi:MAG TPA: ATP-binding protein, partial [Candidatus Lachnoclostridium pullistercoris]|nr:ATP-binding protein [Candidatus Lachnoclostridium pullistercoris]